MTPYPQHPVSHQFHPVCSASSQAHQNQPSRDPHSPSRSCSTASSLMTPLSSSSLLIHMRHYCPFAFLEHSCENVTLWSNFSRFLGLGLAATYISEFTTLSHISFLRHQPSGLRAPAKHILWFPTPSMSSLPIQISHMIQSWVQMSLP